MFLHARRASIPPTRLIRAVHFTLAVALADSARATPITVCNSGCTYPTIDAALDDSATTGQIIEVQAGTYRYSSRIATSNKDATPSAPTILRANGPVIIDCADDLSGAPWTQHSTVYPNIYTASRASNLMEPPKTQVHVNGLRYTFVDDTAYTNVQPNEWKYDAGAATLYVNVGGESPAVHSIFVGDKNRDPGIEITDSDYLVIDGITILRASGKGIYLHGSEPSRAISNVVQNSTVAQCWDQGIHYVSTRRGYIINNDTYDNGDHGIHVVMSDTCGITHNTSYNNDDPLEERGGKAGIKLGDSTVDTNRTVANCWIDYNIVHHNEDTGIDLLGARLIAVRRNVSFRNRDHGFDNNTTDYTIFINNTAFKNDHDGISVERTSAHVGVYNCIFAHNAITGATLEGGSGRVREMFVDSSTTFTSNYNILAGLTPGSIPGETGSARYLVEWRTSPTTTAKHESMGDYQAATGQDAASYNTLPTFADANNFNLAIADNAGTDDAIDAAKSDITGWLTPMWLSVDPDGVPPHDAAAFDAGVGPPRYGDIGAFEYDPRPGPTDSLVANCEPGNEGVWRLAWKAVSDDSVSNGDPVAQYDVKWALSSITEESWANGATSVGGPTPLNPGAGQLWWVQAPQLRYFRLKAKDVNGHWSALSNEVSINPVGEFCGESWYGGGGGGGGGEHEGGLRGPSIASGRRPGGGPESVGAGENTIFNGTPLGTRGADLLPIEAVQNAAGSYLTHLRVTRGYGTLVDGVKLLYVDHPVGTEAFASGSTVVAGRRSQASQAVTETGADVTKLLNGTGGVFNAAAAVAVTVATPLDSLESPLVIECANGGVRGHAIIVESQSPSGWREVGAVYPRQSSSASVLDSVPTGPVRLRFTGYAQVSSVARLARETADVTSAWGRLEGARSSSAADVLSAVGVEDTVAAALVGPDTLVAVFSGPPLGQGAVRNVFLGISATPVTASGATSYAASQRSSVPTQFALYQNVPNPFRGSTTIRLDLPVGRMVRLEIFDVSGRRVRTLINHFMPAGRQSVVWNQRDDAGAELGAGVYFTRLLSRYLPRPQEADSHALV